MSGAAAAGALVVCVGNDLVADDGVACVVHERLEAAPLPPGTRLHRLGLAGLALLDLLDGEPLLVVVDAVQLGAPPGTLHVLDWERVPPARGAAVSVHGIGLREALDVGARLQPERMPRRTVLVGVEGACFTELGGPLTPAVAASVDDAVRAVHALLDGGRGAAPDAAGPRPGGAAGGESGT